MSKIKVLMISEEGRGGGPLKRMLLVADKLRNELDITIVCPSDASTFIAELKHHHINYKTLPLHALTKNIQGLFVFLIHFFKELRLLKKLISESNPAIVHANGSWQIKAVIVAYQCGIPCIWHMNDSHQPALVKYIYNLFSYLSKYRIYASQRTKDYYKKNNELNLDIIIPAPVRILSFQKRELNKKRPIRIINVSFLSANKGIDIIIKCLYELNKMSHGVTFELSIIGEVINTQQHYFEYLNQLIAQLDIKERVHFEGYQNDIDQCLSKADLYLCASGYESSPMAVWEAMSNGLPVVSSDVGDLKLINQSAICSQIADRNPKALAQAILALIHDDKLRELQIKNARELVETQFSLEHHTQLYLQFCHEVVKHQERS